MGDIVIDTLDGPIKAMLEIPDGTGPWPGVVVIHDMVSLRSDMKAISRRIADAGFLTLAPDLYSRGGTVRCVSRVFTELHARKGRAYDDIDAARATLAGRSDCTGKIGVAGFCMGGGFALVTAARGFDASAPFYPSLPMKYDEMLKGACPVVASLGKRDPVLPGAARRLEKALQRKGIPHDVHEYDGVGHSFANKYPAERLLRIVGFGYDAEVADDAWRRVFAFFGTHLRDDQT